MAIRGDVDLASVSIGDGVKKAVVCSGRGCVGGIGARWVLCCGKYTHVREVTPGLGVRCNACMFLKERVDGPCACGKPVGLVGMPRK